MSNIDEKKLVGANYLFNFYLEVEQLNNHFAAYKQSLIYIENVGVDKIEDTDRQTLNNLLQTLKQLVISTYIKYNSIYKFLYKPKKSKIEELDKLYNLVLVKYIIVEKDLLNYVLKLNSFVVEDVIQTLLHNSKTILDAFGGMNNGGANDGGEQTTS